MNDELLNTQQMDRIQSLKHEIERILDINSISLEERLQGSDTSQSSIEQLFGRIADEYKEKQEQIATLGRLVLHTIDLLTQQIQEKNDIVGCYDTEIEHFKKALAHADKCILDYTNQLQECQYAKSVLEKQLLEANEIRQRYQTLYEEALCTSKEQVDQLDSTDGDVSMYNKPADSFSQNTEKRQLELMLLEHELKQLKNELNYKDSLISQKETARQQLLDRLRCQTDKSAAIHNNFRMLQQNFRYAVTENQQLKRSIEELQAKVQEAECSKRQDFLAPERENLQQFKSKDFERKKTQKSLVNAEKSYLQRSRSNFSLSSQKSAAIIKASLAAEMKAFDTESKQALSRFEYRLQEPQFQTIKTPKIYTLHVPQKVEESTVIPTEATSSIVNEAVCQKCMNKDTTMQSWISSKLCSLYGTLKGYVVTSRVRKQKAN